MTVVHRLLAWLEAKPIRWTLLIPIGGLVSAAIQGYGQVVVFLLVIEVAMIAYFVRQSKRDISD